MHLDTLISFPDALTPFHSFSFIVSLFVLCRHEQLLPWALAIAEMVTGI